MKPEVNATSLMQVQIYTLEGTWFDGPSCGVVTQTEEGGIEILPGHTALLAVLAMGPLVVRQNDDQSIFFISGGIIHVMEQKVIILADEAHRARDLDEAAANKARQKAMDRLSNQGDNVNYSEVIREIAFAREQLRVIRMSKTDA